MVTAVGLVLALLANIISPRGLSLGRNYFPRNEHPAPAFGVTGAPQTAEVSDVPSASDVTNALAVRLEAEGLKLLGMPEVTALYRDPRREQELVVFIDARNDREYEAGHVPGAYLFDRYYPEQHLPVVLPVCQQAEAIAVYCAGGDCEDSEFAALALRDAGIPVERLGICAGGLEAWVTHGLPVEVGMRGSGVLKEEGATR
ncbi:MAG TPA: rhodanese-like domain-containing protein [Verrucomicrobiota bacterium]|nr:rhodanese-like domain-containing protein [Verrucomicrobiota bacterium]HNU52414.1 rhodanese-like domain-containing protein [Verrucomicrobiota bacterium]